MQRISGRIVDVPNRVEFPGTVEFSGGVIRHIRRDINEDVKKAEKAKTITEDDSKRMQDEVQKLTDSFIKVLDDKMAKKEKEVMTV